VTDETLRVQERDGSWRLTGSATSRFELVNEFLGSLADRNYSPRTQRAYAFDLLGFCRCLSRENVELAEVDTDVLLRFLTTCREAVLPGGNVERFTTAGHRVCLY
jgi:Phage integrase, N-terminal SAM-like domain.